MPAHRERPGDWSGRFPLITEAALRNRNSSFVIDGEAVLLGVYGRSDFNGLHTRKHDHEVEFYAFDMLVSAGDDLRRLPLGMRKDAAQQRVAYGSTSSECCYCRSAEPLPLQTVGSNGQEGTDHEIVLALLVAVNAWGIMPASSEDRTWIKSGIVRQPLHGGIDPTPCRAGPEHSTCQRG